MLYALFYIIGMIVAHRHVNDMELYFNYNLFTLAMLYLIPSMVIGTISILILKNSYTGMIISPIVGMAIGAIYIYIGINSPDQPEKNGLYKTSILLIYFGFCAVIMMFISAYVKLNLGNFFPLFIGWVSFLNSFMILYICVTTVSAFINHERS
jgi:hypothetical protein